MTSQRWVSLGIVVAAVSVWSYLLLKSDNDPAALEKLVGCYQSHDAAEPRQLRVLASGKLVSEYFSYRATGYSDKTGDALMVQVGNSGPMLVRSDEQHQRLTIPGGRGYEVTYKRRAC